MTLADTSGKQPAVLGRNRIKPVAAEVLMAGGSIVRLGRRRATQRWHQLLLPTWGCVVLLFRCGSPLQLCHSNRLWEHRLNGIAENNPSGELF